jgi:hypothetical protein
MLTHRCNVFHITDAGTISRPTYGVPIGSYQPEYTYPEVADLIDVPCYFTEKNQNVVQGEPNQTITQTFLVHFLSATDVRINDKVLWDGVEFKLRKPRKIKNHHIEVIAVRSESL